MHARNREGMPLSPRQREIALLIAQGKLNKQIALQLGISEQTVKNHVTGIFERTNCTNRTEVAVRYASEINKGAGI